MSPGDYQRQLRLREARSLIAAGRPISEAAALAGFADQSHLSRWFTRSYGVTPGDYQRAAVQRSASLSGRHCVTPGHYQRAAVQRSASLSDFTVRAMVFAVARRPRSVALLCPRWPPLTGAAAASRAGRRRYGNGPGDVGATVRSGRSGI
jgi:hypothetical protein